jgi:copper(I)-binding protein
MTSVSADHLAAAGRRITRKTVAAAATAALVPVGACAVTLGLLVGYVKSGVAGVPPAEVSVTRARIFPPIGDRDTVAFLDLRNTGGRDATLVSVDSPLYGTSTMLARDVERGGAGRMEVVDTVKVPAGASVSMSPSIVDVMIQDPPPLELGEKVEFVLRFEDGSRVTATAEAVRRGTP